MLNFPEVEKLFHIISTDTRTVLVNEDIIQRIEAFEPVRWQDIQKNSVQIWGYNIDKLHIPEITHHAGIYKWHLEYSTFLGYMEGVLKMNDFIGVGGGIV